MLWVLDSDILVPNLPNFYESFRSFYCSKNDKMRVNLIFIYALWIAQQYDLNGSIFYRNASDIDEEFDRFSASITRFKLSNWDRDFLDGEKRYLSILKNVNPNLLQSWFWSYSLRYSGNKKVGGTLLTFSGERPQIHSYLWFL